MFSARQRSVVVVVVVVLLLPSSQLSFLLSHTCHSYSWRESDQKKILLPHTPFSSFSSLVLFLYTKVKKKKHTHTHTHHTTPYTQVLSSFSFSYLFTGIAQRNDTGIFFVSSSIGLFLSRIFVSCLILVWSFFFSLKSFFCLLCSLLCVFGIHKIFRFTTWQPSIR